MIFQQELSIEHRLVIARGLILLFVAVAAMVNMFSRTVADAPQMVAHSAIGSQLARAVIHCAFFAVIGLLLGKQPTGEGGTWLALQHVLVGGLVVEVVQVLTKNEEIMLTTASAAGADMVVNFAGAWLGLIMLRFWRQSVLK